MRCGRLTIAGLLLASTVWANTQAASKKLHQAFSHYYQSAVNHRLTAIDIQLITWSVGSCGEGFSFRCTISRPVLEHLSQRSSTGAKLLLSAQLLETGIAADRSIATGLLKELASKYKDAEWVTSQVKPVLVSLEKTPRKPARSKPSKNAHVEDRPTENNNESRIDNRPDPQAVGQGEEFANSESPEAEKDSELEGDINGQATEPTPKKRLLIIIDQ